LDDSICDRCHRIAPIYALAQQSRCSLTCKIENAMLFSAFLLNPSARGEQTRGIMSIWTRHWGYLGKIHGLESS
jgi:hypothetical protein